MEQARPRVWRWLAQRVNDPETVSDLTQEVLAKLWENRRRWNPELGFGQWVLRITANHYCDWRRRRPQDLLSQALSWEETTENESWATEEPSPEEALLQDELRTKIHNAITELPIKYREVLWLYYVEGWKCADIANALKLTMTQVEGRLFRGRSKLKAPLEPFIE